MPLLACSLTGASDDVNPSALIDLSARFPFVEWGILWSPDRSGSGRYPSRQWIREVGAIPNLRRALHLCGKGVDQFLLDDPDVRALLPGFGRIQLNFNLAAKPRDLRPIWDHLLTCDIPLITQGNEGNASVPAQLPHRRHQVLFDASGGRGIAADAWKSPIPGVTCGYAGGLGPHNVATELPLIEAAAGGADFWIDMEGRIRTPDDLFDLEAAEQVLTIVAAHYARAR